MAMAWVSSQGGLNCDTEMDGHLMMDRHPRVKPQAHSPGNPGNSWRQGIYLPNGRSPVTS